MLRKVNIADIPEHERHSPKGKFRSYRKNISVALGREPESLDLAQRHPFDVMLSRIPPGAAYCPYHVESAQFEFYHVVSGHGISRDESGRHAIAPGDAFYYAPGEAHQLINEGSEDLVYYVIADNPIGDCCYYPDSNKWAAKLSTGENHILKGPETDYFDGEE